MNENIDSIEAIHFNRQYEIVTRPIQGEAVRTRIQVRRGDSIESMEFQTNCNVYELAGHLLAFARQILPDNKNPLESNDASG